MKYHFTVSIGDERSTDSQLKHPTEAPNTCPKLSRETLEQGVSYVQS